MEEWAPPTWAESWDRIGLQVGDPAAAVNRVLAALEVTDAVLAEAEAAGANLLVVHHPVIFRPLGEVRLDRPAGRRLQQLLRAGLSVYVAHTNLDVAPGGTNDLLAHLVGLVEAEVLQPAGQERLVKLVAFVPAGYEDRVRDALAAGGAGQIGNYSHCTFQSPGTGTFRPLAGAQPFRGEVGSLERADELRLETILPQRRTAAAIHALLSAHPYEEVAYDLYPLENPGPVRGHGRIGSLSEPITLAALAERVRVTLGVSGVKVAGDPGMVIDRVAVGPGSGGSLIPLAAARGAQALVAGDIDHHDARDALEAGMAIVDPGHFASEQPVVAAMVRRVQSGLAARGLAPEVAAVQARGPFDPFR